MSRRRSGLNFSRRRKKFNLPLFKEILSWVVEILVVIIIAYVMVESFGFRTSVVGQAMEAQLTNGEQIFIQILDGAVYINGNLYNEKTAVSSVDDPGLAEDEIILGDDEYFVLGDNRNNSEDSRFANIGNVKKDYIIGKAWFHFAGLTDMGKIR